MNRFLVLLTVACCTAFSALAGDARSKATEAPLSAALAAAPAGGQLDAAFSAGASATIAASRAAYAAAWQRATTASLHTDALRVADVLARQIGLRPGPARATVERFVDQQIAQCPGCFAGAAPLDASTTLVILIRQDVTGFQRALSAVLPDESFVRYTALLDALKISTN